MRYVVDLKGVEVKIEVDGGKGKSDAVCAVVELLLRGRGGGDSTILTGGLIAVIAINKTPENEVLVLGEINK